MTDDEITLSDKTLRQALLNEHRTMSRAIGNLSAQMAVTLERIEKVTNQAQKIPFALVLIGVSSWFLNNGKIEPHVWLTCNCMAVFPWLGEGLRSLLKRDTVETVKTIIVITIAAASLLTK
jgi:hypothetical protein